MTLSTVRQGYPLLLAAIHPIAQFHRLHAVIVRRAHSDGDFLDVGDLGVAPRFIDTYTGRVVAYGIDGVLHRTGHDGTALGYEVDAIVASLRDAERRADAAVLRKLERHGFAVVEHERTAAHGKGDGRTEDHSSTDDGGDVAAIVHVLCRQARVGGVVQVHRQALYRRQLGDGQRVDWRRDAVGFDVVLGWAREIEHARCEGARGRIARHRQTNPLRAGIRPEHEFGALGAKTDQPRANVHGRAARNGGVARPDAHRKPGDRRFRHGPWREELARRIAQRGGTDDEEERTRDGDEAEPPARAQHARALELRAAVQWTDENQRALHQPGGERRRRALLFGQSKLVDGGEQGLS